MPQWTAPPPTPDIRRVGPEETFYHGTRAEPFKSPNPGTCFTRDANLALFYAETGSYYAMTSQQGTQRVLTATIQIPTGAAFIPTSQLFREYISMLETEKIRSRQHALENAVAQREIRLEYHAEAQAIAITLGVVAYYADLYHGEQETALVVLEPLAVTIVQHNVREVLIKSAA